jgi:CRP-like cAMP-binding protein
MDKILKWLKTLFNKQDKYISLRRYPIFKELTSFELYLLNNFMHARSYKVGEILFDKDYPLEVIFFIEKGEIEIEGHTHPRGKNILKKNQFLGLMDMFHENIRTSKATALTEVQALAISKSDLLDLVNKNPRMGVKILSGVCKSFSNYIFQIAALHDTEQS